MVFELGLTAAPRFNLREICHPALTRIAEATGDTVFLTQRSGLDAVCLDRREGTFPIKTFTLEIGMRRPLGVGTGSLAILSALPEEEIQQVVARTTSRLPEYGLNGAPLLAQVKRAQKLGYAMREMPGLAGVRSVGQALRNQGGVAVRRDFGLHDLEPDEREARRGNRDVAQERDTPDRAPDLERQRSALNGAVRRGSRAPDPRPARLRPGGRNLALQPGPARGSLRMRNRTPRGSPASPRDGKRRSHEVRSAGMAQAAVRAGERREDSSRRRTRAVPT